MFRQNGEEIAAEYLRLHGFEILETNWRFRRLEVDIIAREGKTLIFVEVKTRSYDYFGKPEEFVTPAKERRLAAAAAAYMEQSGHEWAMRFDVVAVLKKRDGSPPRVDAHQAPCALGEPCQSPSEVPDHSGQDGPHHENDPQTTLPGRRQGPGRPRA